jgi:hypothetical protein
MQTDENKTFDLTKLVLKHGSHPDRDRGMCLMEAVAWFANEPHSDTPSCADPVLTSVGIRLNDRWSDEERQRLVPLIPLIVGTRGSRELSKRRGLYICDRILRWHYPQMFRSLPGKPRKDIAERFENLPPVIDRESAERARDLARAIRKELEGAVHWTAYAYDAAADAAADADAYAYDADAYAYDADAYAYDAAAADAYAAAAYAAYAYAAYAYAAYAYAAYAYAAYAYAAAAAAAAARQKLLDDIRALRPQSIDRLVQILREACALTEATA